MRRAVYICPRILGGCGFVGMQDVWKSVTVVTNQKVTKLCPECEKEGQFLSDANFSQWATRENREKAQKMLDEWRSLLAGEVLIFHFMQDEVDLDKLSEFQLRQIENYNPPTD